MRNIHLILTTVHSVKSKVEISHNFVAFSEYMNFKNLHRKEVHTSQNYTANILWESFIFQCKFVRLFYLCFRWKTPMKPFASTMKPCTIFAFVLWNLPTLLMEIWTIWFPWPCQVKFFFRRRPQKIEKIWQIFLVLLEITNFMIALWFI